MQTNKKPLVGGSQKISAAERLTQYSAMLTTCLMLVNCAPATALLGGGL